MTKVDIAEKMHTKLGFNKKDSADMLEAVLDIIKSTLESGDKVKIQGFGSFNVIHKNSRRGRNPKTGETLTIESRSIVTFRTSAILKAKINKG